MSFRKKNKIGIAHQILTEKFQVDDDSQECLYGHVLFLYFKNNKSCGVTCNEVNERFKFNTVDLNIVPVVKIFRKYHNLTRPTERERFEKMCHKVFDPKPPSTAPKPNTSMDHSEGDHTEMPSGQEECSASTSADGHLQCSDVQQCPLQSVSAESGLWSSAPTLFQTTCSSQCRGDHTPMFQSTCSSHCGGGPTPMFQSTCSSHCGGGPTSMFQSTCSCHCGGGHTPLTVSSGKQPSSLLQASIRSRRRQPDTAREAQLRERLAFVSCSVRELKERHQAKVRDLKLKLTRMPTVRVLNQKIARRDLTIQQLKKQLKEKGYSEELRKLKSLNNYLKQRQATVKSKHSEDMVKMFKAKDEALKALKHKLAEQSKIIYDLQCQNLALEEKLQSLKEEAAREKEVCLKRDQKTYSSQVRQMVFDMVLNQVATSRVPVLLKSLCQRLGHGLDKIPHRSTVEGMVRELGVIAELQSAETAMREEELTLGFEVSSREGVNVNVVHLSAGSQRQVVAVDQVEGCSAENYQQHICASIDRLAATYASFHQADYQECRDTLLRHMANTRTTRSTLKQATVRLVCRSWGKALKELHCHLHPLDSVANACGSALRTVERDGGLSSGDQCLAVKVVLWMNKMRYNASQGDPKGFSAFLKERGLKRDVLPRYRGSESQVLFILCGTFIQHYALLETFLATATVPCTDLQANILTAFRNPTAIAEFCVLGIFGQLLSVPWMRKFYSSAQDKVQHIEGIAAVKDVLSSLAQSTKAPLQLLDRTTDLFGDPMDCEGVWKALNDCCPRDQAVEAMMAACLEAITDALNRQYSDYLTPDLSERLKKEAHSARLHSIDAEEMKAILDAAKQHSPSATLGFLSAKVRAKKNGTLAYLDAMDAEKREKVIRWAPAQTSRRKTEKRRPLGKMREELAQRSPLQTPETGVQDPQRLQQLLETLHCQDLAQTFPDLDEKSQSDLSDILSDCVAGRSICHRWYDPASHRHTMYNGKIERVCSTNKNMYVVAYWTLEESYDHAVDYNVSKYELAADVLYGSLMLS